MKIHEYQAKDILKSNGIIIPEGILVDSVDSGVRASAKIGFPLVVKAQVHIGGRGKAGAIKIIKEKSEFKDQLLSLFKLKVKGLAVKKVLIEEMLDIKSQFYLGLTLDRSKQKNVIMVSGEGGIEIETVAKKTPEKITSITIDELQKSKENINILVNALGLTGDKGDNFVKISENLIVVYDSIDAELLEINPLVLTSDGRIIACDAKIIIDDNALFRHPEFENLKEDSEDNELEGYAHKLGIAYVKLDGNIGIIGNGAGLVMATMDEVKRAGGKPANFLDIGGGARKETMCNCLDVIYKDKDVGGIFINIFGGITRCDEVARGMIEVLKNVPRKLPIVLRLAGTKAQEAKEILDGSNLIGVGTMEEGAKRIVELINNS